MIDVLNHLHGLDLVHRDIKPDNILLRNNGFDPVLVDFGLVRDLTATSLTASWALRGPGTPYFASPEQLNNQKDLIDWRSDQFSLGVVASFCQFGLHPYQTPDEPVFASTTVDRVASRGDFGSSFLNSVQNNGCAFLQKMVSPWPVSRYRNPANLVSAINER
jgi:serine/threonine protein kinase